MPGELKFSSFGIPYLMEFANVSIRGASDSTETLVEKPSPFKAPKGPKPPLKPKPLRSKTFPLFRSKSKAGTDARPPHAPKRCPTCGEWPQNDPPPFEPPVDTLASRFNNFPDPNMLASRPGGLYIQYLVDQDVEISEKRRLLRVKRTIAEAVTRAGMSSPGEEITNPVGSLHPSSAAGDKASDRTSAAKRQALFKGTYGQVKQALTAAGLKASPCPEDGILGATRLGALFVADSHSKDNVTFSKITLWG